LDLDPSLVSDFSLSL